MKSAIRVSEVNDQAEQKNPTTEQARILRLPEVIHLTGLSRTTIWRMQQARDFPPSVKLGLRATGFVAENVFNWIRSRK